jgi:hypothetical protein
MYVRAQGKLLFSIDLNRPGRIRLEIQEAPVNNANQLRLENLKRRGYLETLSQNEDTIKMIFLM